MHTKTLIEQAWLDRTLLQNNNTIEAIETVITLLDQGKIRVATPSKTGWETNTWIKKAIMLYFAIRQMELVEVGPFVFHDKLTLKKNYIQQQIRVVPLAIARYGSFLASGVILMASYVNIGAYVDENTMIDSNAVVGSCAQIGKNIHISAGVVIGGVLEPAQAKPVIIENGAFIGANSVVVEGVHIGKEAVLGANVTITATTHIIDVTQAIPTTIHGYVPEKSVIIPGTFQKKFPAGNYHVPCALLIGKRKASTNAKTALNEALRSTSPNLKHNNLIS